MSLVEHAERELALLGEEPEIVAWYLDVIRAFTSYRHSGGSASVVLPVLFKLLHHEALTPLTDDPDEWRDVSEKTGRPNWQNVRDSRAFSEDGGQTYWMLGDYQLVRRSQPHV